MPGRYPGPSLIGSTSTGSVKPQNPATSGWDPLKGWAKLTHQLGPVSARRMDVIRSVRESLLPSVRV